MTSAFPPTNPPNLFAQIMENPTVEEPYNLLALCGSVIQALQALIIKNEHSVLLCDNLIRLQHYIHRFAVFEYYRDGFINEFRLTAYDECGAVIPVKFMRSTFNGIYNDINAKIIAESVLPVTKYPGFEFVADAFYTACLQVVANRASFDIDLDYPNYPDSGNDEKRRILMQDRMMTVEAFKAFDAEVRSAKK